MSAFIVSEETMHRAVRAMDPNYSPHYISNATTSGQDLDQLGRQLYALNHAAIRARYPNHAAISTEEVTTYQYPGRHDVSKVQLLRSLECLIYQCSEGDVPETDLYKRMQERATELAHSIVRDLPEYRAAKWD